MPRGGKAFPILLLNRNERGARSDETNRIKVTFAKVGDFVKLTLYSVRAPISTIFRMENNLYIFMYYEFYNLQ